MVARHAVEGRLDAAEDLQRFGQVLFLLRYARSPL
jgi:hypothetical protein